MTAKAAEIGPLFLFNERSKKWESILHAVRPLRSWSGR